MLGVHKQPVRNNCSWSLGWCPQHKGGKTFILCPGDVRMGSFIGLKEGKTRAAQRSTVSCSFSLTYLLHRLFFLKHICFNTCRASHLRWALGLVDKALTGCLYPILERLGSFLALPLFLTSCWCEPWWLNWIGPCYPRGRPELSSWCPTLACPRPGYGGHLGSDTVNGMLSP